MEAGLSSGPRALGAGDLCTTPAVLDLMAHEFPERVALIGGTRRLTFRQLRAEVRRAAAGLIDRGVDSGDRVAIWQPNSWHWVVACLAIHYAGATVVPLNTRYTAREAGDILGRVGARLLIAADRFAGVDRLAGIDRRTLPALKHIIRISSNDSDIDVDESWNALLVASEAALGQVDTRAGSVRADDVSDIVFTSGTTGRGKGVLCSHRQSLSATAAVWSVSGGLNGDDRYLCVNPFFHTFGFRFGIVACLQAGATLIPEPAFDPEVAMARISDHRVTVFPGPPTVYQMLLDHPGRERYDLSSWRLAVTGSTVLPRILIERMQTDLNVGTVVTGYGLTEASGYGTTTRPSDDAVTVATTVGRPIPGFELCINEPDGSGVGEVLLRGPNVMLGYLDDPVATAEAVDARGWLHTGDLGTVDERGNLRIVGRLKDMYVCGGLNVYSAEVEQVLAGLAGVVEVAVVGVPDAKMGEVGRAFIVGRDDARLDGNVVKDYARTHLADFKVPRSVFFVDELPRTASGKVLKSDLRDRACLTDPVVPLGSGGPPAGMAEAWVADAWQTLLDIDRPGRLDRFTDLGGDSVSAMEFCRMLDLEFGFRISVDRFAALQTISALVTELQPGSGRGREFVVRLRSDGCGPICVVIPGLGGNTWTYARLAAAVSGPCDVLAVSLIDVGVGGGIRSAIRSAVHAALEKEAPAGRPIVVMGFSFGALIAADLACWLGHRGVTVDSLLLLDPKPLDSARLRRRPLAVIKDAVRPAFRTLKRALDFSRSAAAKGLEAEIGTVSRKLVTAYLDGSIRLPHVAVACVRSRELINEQGSATTLFSTPIEAIDTEVVELGHNDLVSRRSGIAQIAGWLDRHLMRCSSAAVLPPAPAQQLG